MKIATVNNTNFQHSLVKPSKLTNFMYSAALTASLLTATADSFKKTEEPKENRIEQIAPQKAQFQNTMKTINNIAGEKLESSLGAWVVAGLAVVGAFLYNKLEHN